MVRHPIAWLQSRFRFVCFLIKRFKRRYDRRPSSSARRYSELAAAGVVRGATEKEWRGKDLSSCLLARDPECLPAAGAAGDLPAAYLCGQGQGCRLVGSREALARWGGEATWPLVGDGRECLPVGACS